MPELHIDRLTRDTNIVSPSYVEKKPTIQAVDVTMLNAEIARILAQQQELRTAIEVIVPT